MPDLAKQTNKQIGHPLNLEFQINIGYISSMFAYLKFQVDWAFWFYLAAWALATGQAEPGARDISDEGSCAVKSLLAEWSQVIPGERHTEGVIEPLLPVVP